MSQQSVRSSAFLDEMGVGPLWQLRHPTPSQPDAAPGEVMDAPAVQVAAPVPAAPAVSAAQIMSAAVPVAAPTFAPTAPAAAPAPVPVAAPAPVQAPAREAETPAVSAPMAAAMAAPEPDALDAANASAADLADDDSTAWFDDAPTPARPAPVSEEAIAAMDWPALKQAIASCTRCDLCATRRATVQGRGHTGAQWMAVTAAPNRLDEKEGRAVAGEAGKLLDNMLKAIGLTTETDVYLTGLVKCRPAGDDGAERAPSPDEVAACRPFLERELALTGAGMVLTFGQAAAKGLLGVASRGKVHRHGALPVVATYHPADLLRRPEDKAKAWADLCLARGMRDHAA
ncbi:uracil-DNA glycosylase [Rugamonas apoptosis]|uniref:uracil-DNA glycosylase n=1 Tax=Rugamonas apoptosis TaxID=2758570 RepID=UPI001E3C84D4|nr:uracil-DNA glycosylase [Rugamonas apoptosis]